MIFRSLIDVDCKNYKTFLFTFDKDDDEIFVGCVAKVITRGNLQDENG